MLYISQKILLVVGIFFCLVGVIAGAFGSHYFKKRLEHERLSAYIVAYRYQIYHGFAICLAAILSSFSHGFLALIAGWIFFIGILAFSGSLYFISLTGKRGFGAATPVGGMILIFAWLLLAFSVIQIG